MLEEPPSQGELPRLCPLGSCWILGLVSLLLIIKKVSFFHLNMTRSAKIQVIPLTKKLYTVSHLYILGNLEYIFFLMEMII